MHGKIHQRTDGRAGRWRMAGALVMALLLGACGSHVPDSGASQQLNVGYRALESKQFDQALAAADGYLRQRPTGSGSAEALYLRGRALSERPAASESEAQSNLTAARSAYVEALRLSPGATLESYIRTSLGNAAYFQDDFATASEQWARAYEQLEKPDLRAWVLYRLGRAQQRLGRFEQADRTFAQVQRQFPNTPQANLSREAAGARQFYVQLATFNSAASAQRAAEALRRSGVTPVIDANPTGQQVLRVGPVGTYPQAKTLRGRFTGEYPDAIIVP